MKIVVTGGAGFIGSHFIRALYKRISFQDEVVLIDSLTYAGNKKNFKDFLDYPGFTFFEGDICDPQLPDELFLNASSVVNFAAESHVDRSIESSSDFVHTNVEGTRNLLDLTIRSGVRKFLQVSTDEVYGSIPQGAWDENFPLSPNSPYAASKASADLIVRAYNRTYGLHTNITRCSNNFGTHQFPEKFIPVIIRAIHSGQKVPLYGDGLNRRDWLHVEDHCDALMSVMLDGRNGEVYNIGGGTELTNLDLARKILKLMGSNESLISHVPDRKGHDFRYSVDDTKIRNELGYLPSRSLDSSLLEVINWYKANQNWWD
jgi:dTDP-glucose 4,6-dehydratase